MSEIALTPGRDGVFHSRRRATGVVRPFEECDMVRAAELHESVMPRADHRVSDSLRAHLLRIMLRHPWRAESLPSLVFEDNDGKVIGCLGVMSRPMSFRGRPITAAISHSFPVPVPTIRRAFVGLVAGDAGTKARVRRVSQRGRSQRAARDDRLVSVLCGFRGYRYRGADRGARGMRRAGARPPSPSCEATRRERRVGPGGSRAVSCARQEGLPVSP